MGDARGASAAEADYATRVLIVDDHELLAHILEKSFVDAGFDAIAVTGCRLDDVASIATEIQPDVCLLDLDLGPAGDGRTLIAPLRDLGCVIILLTGSRDRAAIGEGLENGAFGVMTKNEPFESLMSAVVDAAGGRRDAFLPGRHFCLGALREQRVRDRKRLAPFERLTPREQEVLAEMSRGKLAAEIAESSFVSLCTVRSQIRAILTKLGVPNQLAAVALAHESGWQ